MTKDFLLRLTEEHYGAGTFPTTGGCWRSSS